MRVKTAPSTLARRIVVALLALVAVLSCPAALGSGPRWVTGPPFFTTSGNPVAWYTTSPQYFTDPGDLSPYVSHAAAEALVANAAATWNVPTSSLVLTRGGSLDEHVSGGNVIAGSSGVTFPSDVQPANYQAKQIAVIYDTDGSVTDLILGTGASDPSGCRQAAVTESVDAFAPAGQVLHALLVLNGRCTGPDPDQQVQMQYQLMRGFGRVLGLGWSQTNDNVFTGVPTPTPSQAANWPVMHPIDIICGPYTYKCMPQPFVLRPDDVASLSFVYPIDQGQAPIGKQDTLANAFTLDGFMFLPSGQGMEGVNVTVRRRHMFWTTVEDWQSVSAVTGYSFRPQTSTPITAQDGSPLSSIGSYDDWREGYFRMTGIPIGATDAWETVVITTEPINPLYTGPYAVGSYTGNTIAPSGLAATQESQLAPRYGWNREGIVPANAAAQCTATADGTVNAPAPVVTEGWWNGMLCGYGHTAWNSLAVRAGRTLTLEVTALDEQGNATMAKAMPVMGAWNSADDTGAAPTLGSSPAAFNSLVGGMTRLALRSPAVGGTVRLAVADQRGAGRPDFPYQARVLYADRITPANVPVTGGSVTITGMGFRPGMSVLVRGVAAVVRSVTATQITATVPSLLTLGASRALIADVTVLDPATAGSSTMTGALGYASSSERLQVLSVPSGDVTVGVSVPTAFKVQVVASDGVTPVAGESVTFRVTGSARYDLCGGPVCTALTDRNGIAATNLTPTDAGAMTLSVATPSVTLTPFRLVATTAPDTLGLVSAPNGVQTTGLPAAVSFAVRLTAGDAVTPRAGQTVTFSAAGAPVLFDACGSALCRAVTDSNGVATTAVTVLAPGTAVLTASAPAGSVSVNVSAAAPSMRLVSAPAGLVTLGLQALTSFSVQVLAGDGTTALPGEAVAFMANGGGVHFSPCGAATCTVLSDAHGVASVSVIPSVAGAIVLSAAAREGVVTATLTAGAAVLRRVTIPSGSVPIGTPAASAFAVQLLQADGVTPMSGEAVLFSIAAGSVQLAGCSAVPCTLHTDAQGRASVGMTPLAEGPATVVASAAGASLSASIEGIALPNVLQTVSTPGASVYSGDTAPVAFAVRVMTGDLRAGVAGQAVTFSAANNGVVFNACGAAVCTLRTDNAGLATTTVSGVTPGSVRLQATAAAGTAAASITVLARNRSVTALRPVLYIAEGTPFRWTDQVVVADDSGSAAGVPMNWTGSGALRYDASLATTSEAATSTMPASVSALGAGITARGTICAWRTVCATTAAIGVSGLELQVVIDGGAGQSIAIDGNVAPVRLRVQNAAGDPVAGAAVIVRQTTSAWEAGCSEHGRCGTAAVLRASQQTLPSDVDGYLVLTPDELPGIATVTSIAASVGTQGFAALQVERHP